MSEPTPTPETDALEDSLVAQDKQYPASENSAFVKHCVEKLMAQCRALEIQRNAAEADAAETESVNSDLRTVNARLVAERDAMQTDNGILRTVNLSLTTDLRAATQRADTGGDFEG